jgi:hypothetical protein
MAPLEGMVGAVEALGEEGVEGKKGEEGEDTEESRAENKPWRDLLGEVEALRAARAAIEESVPEVLMTGKGMELMPLVAGKREVPHCTI